MSAMNETHIIWPNSEQNGREVVAHFTRGETANGQVRCMIKGNLAALKVVLISVAKRTDSQKPLGTAIDLEEYLKKVKNGDKHVPIFESAFEDRSLFTGFDGMPLSNRSSFFQQLVSNAFVDDVVSSNLDSGEMDFSPSVYELAGLIFENEDQTSAFLDNPSGFVEQSGLTFSAEEEKLILEAANKKHEVGTILDLAELGDSAGDGNTYLLLGSGVPDEAQLAWLQQSLNEIQEVYGFLPAYGGYVTEAVFRSRVIIGPGVTEREIAYLRRNVGDLLDRRGVDGIGEPIGSLHEGFFVAD